jgi:protein-S-isoprenylcysteine O-methyltransferase Ste14
VNAALAAQQTDEADGRLRRPQLIGRALGRSGEAPVELDLYRIATAIVAIVALQRVLVIFYFTVTRLWAYRKTAVAIPTSCTDFVTYPEPPLLLVVTALLWLRGVPPTEPAILQSVRVLSAAGVALAAFAFGIWALRSIPGVSPGHYVLPDQVVVTGGAYGVVRHPLYLQAILVWLTIALGFSSLTAFVITLLYVIPAYIAFARSEEKMMLEEMGEAYSAYRERVGMFLPRLWRASGNR